MQIAESPMTAFYNCCLVQENSVCRNFKIEFFLYFSIAKSIAPIKLILDLQDCSLTPVSKTAKIKENLKIVVK